MTRLLKIWIAVLTVFLLAGCATTQKTEEDPFLTEWLERAEEAQGHSPHVREREILDIDTMFIDLEELEDPEPEREMPTEKVSLSMRQAPVSAVLRSLSRVADQNIIISETVEGTMNLDIKDIPWDQAFKSIIASRGLTYIWEGDILRVKSMQDLRMNLDLAELEEEIGRKRLAKELTAPMRQQIIKINYSDPEQLRDNLTDFLTRDAEGEPRGFIRVAQETNSLVIQASHNDLKRMQRMIEHLDRPRPQILIEANIVEATRSTARELGMRWSGRYITSSGRVSDVGILGEGEAPDWDSVIDTAIGEDDIGGMRLGVVGGEIGANVLYAQLRALEEQGELNLLSSPSITTMDNQMAYTEHGERVPFETTDDGDRTVEWEDAVLGLQVTPGIIDGLHMTMDIEVKKDEVDFTRTVQGNPLIRRKHTETNLVVQDGETIVISGLSKHTARESGEGVPGLRNLPGMGWLFKGEKRQEEMEEFMIFLTPTILGTRDGG